MDPVTNIKEKRKKRREGKEGGGREGQEGQTRWSEESQVIDSVNSQYQITKVYPLHQTKKERNLIKAAIPKATKREGKGRE